MVRDLTHRWIRAYEEKQALWIHDGNPKRPHALLTSGNHSDGFFNSRLVIADEDLLREASKDLVDLYTFQIKRDLSDIDLVVGPATGATKLAQLISEEIVKKAPELLDCGYASPEKVEKDGKTTMEFVSNFPGAQHIFTLDRILLCEDVITTGTSTGLCADAVNRRYGRVHHTVLALVNRSGQTHVDGKGILSLVDRHMPIWTPAECPLCRQGSEAIRPKGEENWARLNARY